MVTTPSSVLGTQSVTLAWNPVTNANVAGYKVYYGSASGNYTNITSVGNVTNATIPGLTDGATYYFAATTLSTSGLESGYSSEISYTTSNSLSVIQVNPGSVGYGTVLVGTSTTNNFTVKNIGTGTLSGSAAVSSPFSIVSGANYSLGAGQTQMVMVAFSPLVANSYNQSVSFSGGGGANTTVSGSATNAPVPPSTNTTVSMVQHVSFSSVASAYPLNGTYHGTLPNPTLSGNTAIICAQADGNLPSLTVNVGNQTATLAVSTWDSTKNQSAYIYVLTNLTAGAQTVTVTSGQSLTFVAFDYSEWSGVTGLDASSGASGVATSGSLSSGSLTPMQSGDLLIQYAARDGGAYLTNWTAGSQVNINWALLSADLYHNQAVQWGIYNGQSPVSPTLAMYPAGQNYVTVAAALTTGVAGTTRPAGMKIVSIQHQDQGTFSGDTWNTLPMTNYLQFPTMGNLQVFMFQSGRAALVITNIVGNSGTWTHAPGGTNIGNPTTDIWYCQNATPRQDNKVTCYWKSTGNPGNPTIMMYDIVGASPNPFDQVVTTAGNTGLTRSNAVLTTVITPSLTNGIVLIEANWDMNTATNSSGNFDAAYYDGETLDGPSSVDENNGWMHYYGTASGPFTNTWNFISNASSSSINYWAAQAISFLSGTNYPVISITPSIANEGSCLANTTITNATFSVSNSGSANLNGQATTALPFWTTITNYNLAPGTSTNIPVAFNPAAATNYTQTVSFSGGGGTSGMVSGSGTNGPVPPPIIQVNPGNFEFGTLLVGTILASSFTVQNIGAGTLNGSATVASPFSIVSGGSYSLGAGQTQLVIVAFSPPVASNYNQSVSFSGGGGTNTTVSGSGTNTP